MITDEPDMIIYRLFNDEWKNLVRSIKFRCGGITWADAEDMAIEIGIKFLTFNFTRLEGLTAEDQRKLVHSYLKACVMSAIADYHRNAEAASKLAQVMQTDGKRIRITQEQVKGAFSRLPDEPRFLLDLIFYRGMELDEVQQILAERTGRHLDKRAVQARVGRALEKLRLELARQ